MKKFLYILAVLILAASALALASCNFEEKNEACKHEMIDQTVVESTCDGEGYTLNVCRDCKMEFKTDIKPSLGHSLHGTLTLPTCTEEGFMTYACACGYTYRTDFTPPKGHSMHSMLHNPTCTDQGYTEYFCNCGYSYQTDFVKPLGHSTTKKVTAPTCTEEGYTTYSCGNCSYSYTSDYVIPLGHSFTTKTTRPTSSSTGYTVFKCGCGYEYTGDYVWPSDIFEGAYVDGVEVLAHGIDVSKWNGTINWEEIKAAGIDYVIIRAGSTQGIDPYFEEYYRGAKAAGLGVGCYFYTYALTIEEISAEADLFLSWIAGKQFDYPVYLDMEDPSQEALDGELLTEMCKTFIEKMQSSGYFCGLYVNNNWIQNILNTEKITVYFDVWYARWTLSGEATWPDSFGQRMGMWQYTDKGKIGTHTCNFDMNVSFKDYPTLIKELGYNGY